MMFLLNCHRTLACALSISFAILLSTTTLFSEGSVQLNPNGIAGDPCNGATDVGDLAMVRLYSINADFPQFAGFGSYGTTNSICFTIKDPKEIVYIALSGAATSGGTCNGGFDWRIVGPAGVAHGPFTLTNANANGNDFGPVMAGPDVFNASGYSTAGEYTFQPTVAGEYCIEIDNYISDAHLRNFDISVADCPGAAGNIIDGRLFSQNWAIRTPCVSTIIGCNEDPNVTSLFAGFQPFQNPFDGKIYVLTSDNFVQEVDFGGGSAFGEGFRGLTFSLSFNLTGPGNTGVVLDDRQSKDGSNQTFANPDLFDVYLNPPDPTCYEEGMCGEISFGPILNCAEPLCIAYEVTQPGLIELFLDIDGDGIFTPNSMDVFLAERIVEGDDLTGCIPWDGEDGMGNIVDLGVDYDIFGRYSQGETHFMMYDVENNNPGWEVNIVDPPCANPDFNMYWDDALLDPADNDSGFPAQPLVSLTGTSQPTHIWEDQEDASALGYGESNTINTWFFSNINQIIAVSSCLPMIDIVKTGTFEDESGDGLAQPGETISYVFVVTNAGNTDLEEITVTDPLVTVMGAGPINLLVGEMDNTTFTGSYTLTQTDIDNMMFDNVAMVQGSDPNDGTIVMDTDPDSVMLPQSSSIMLTKTANTAGLQTPPQPGDIITYMFEVCNTGNTTLINVSVTDPLVTVMGAPIASLAPGACDMVTYTGTYAISSDDIAAEMVMNTAMTVGTDPKANMVSDTDDENVPLVLAPMIMLTKTANAANVNDPAVVGDIITYTFELCNTGNVDLSMVTVTDPIVTVSGGPIPLLVAGTCDNTTFTAMYTVMQSDIDDEGVMNVATTTGTDPNGDPVMDTDDEDVPLVANPLIEIIKSGVFNDENGDGLAQLGETISYIFTVSNSGNVTLTNVMVTDPLVTISGGPIPVLLPGVMDMTTFTGTYTLTQQDVDDGMVDNTATTTGTDPNGMPVTDDDPETTNYLQSPEIMITKSGAFDDQNGDGLAQVGETITYSFTVVNTGNVTLTNVTVTDPVVTVSGGPIPVLIPMQSDNMTFTGSYSLTQDDIDNGMVANVATTTGTDPDGMMVMDDDPEDVMLPLMPAIDLVKEGVFDDQNGDGIAQVGETITYTFTVMNTGNVTLTNVTVTDPIVTVSGGPIATLGVGATDNTTFTGSFTLTQTDIDNGMVANVATAMGDDPNGMPVMDDDPEDVPTPQSPAIDLMKTGVFQDENADGIAQVGETIAYTFVVENTGNVTLTNVVVTDPLVTVMGGPIPSLGVGVIDNTTFTGIYTLTQADIDNGMVANVATTSGNDPNGMPVMDDDPEDVQTPQDPAIEIVKTGVFQDENGDGDAQVGESIAYTFVVTNIGNVTLTNVTLTDPIVSVSGIPISLAVGASDNMTFTGVYILTQTDIDNGNVANVATTMGTDPSGMPVTDDDPEDVPVPQEPAIELVKTGVFQDENGDGIAQVGETISYSFSVQNTGNVTLTNVTLTDPLVTVTGGPIPTLPVGAIDNTSFTGTYSLTQVDINNGNVENVATTMGTDPNGDPVTDDDPDDVPVPQMPMIDIIKNGIFNDENGDGLAQPGETITYMFTVENTGNVTLTGVTVTDPLVTVNGGPIILMPGEIDNTTFTGVFTLTQTEVDAGMVLNLATTTGDDPNGDPVVDTDPEDTPYTQQPEIMLTKTGVFQDENGDGVAMVGETISYTFIVTNTGNVTLTNVTVTDPIVTISGGPIASFAPGATDNTTFTGVYTLTQTDIDNGNVANVATTQGMDPDGMTVMDDDPEDVPTPQDPEIEIIKTGVFQDENGDGVAMVGETIAYTFVVSNAGNVTLTNVTVTDPIVTIIGGPLPSLPVGAVDNSTFTGTYTLTQTDIDNGNVANVATTSGTDPNGDPTTDDDPEDVPTPQDPAIDLVKTGVFQDENGDGISQVGETIAYTFVVTNTGNVTLTNVTITDPIVTVVGGPILTLGVGQIDNATFSGTYTLTQTDIDNGNVANIATASGMDPNGDPTTDDDPEDVPTPQNPAIDIVKNGIFQDENGDGLAQPGETISYIFIVTNTGNVTLTGVTVTDPLVTVTGGPITLVPGQVDNSTFVGTYTLSQTDVDDASVMNVATTTGTDPNGMPVMDDDPEDTQYTQEPEIMLIKTGVFQDEDGNGAAQVGETIAYTFSVINTGNVTLTNVTVTDPLVTIIGGPIASLAPGITDNTTFTGVYTLTQDDVDNGNVANVATTSGNDPNGDPVMDDDPEDVMVPQDPAIQLTKNGVFQDEDGDGAAQVGETIAYTFSVVNLGNVTLTDVTITDPIVTIIGGPILSLPVGATDNTTFTGTYTLTQDDIDNGEVLNLAVVSGDDPSGDPVTDDDPEDVPTPQDPAIDLVKSGVFQDENGDGAAQVGETIAYTFSVSNTGNVTLTNVTVSDPIVTVIGGPIPTLVVGQIDNTTFTGTYILTQFDIDAGEVENLATTSGDDPTGTPVTDDDPETSDVPQMPSIDIVKNGVFNDENGDGIAQVGETLSYSFLITNTGNVTLTNVTVMDPLITVMGGPITLAPGQMDNITFSGTYSLTQMDVDAGSVMNTATTSGDDPNGDPVMDEDPEETPFTQSPEISIVKTGVFQDENGDGAAQVGETISYMFTVSNTGNTTLTNVTVTDPLVTVVGGPIPVLAPGTSDNTTFTGTYILTQDDVDNGSVANVATTSGMDPNGDPVTDDDPEDVTTPQDPSIDLVKSGVFQDENGDGIAQVGETIAYTFIVSNTGNVSITNVTITDPIVTVMGGPIAVLPVDAVDNTTFTGVYILTQMDIDNGGVANVATVNGEDPNGDPVDDTDPEDIPTPQAPSIDLVKSGTFTDENGDGISQVGETITYAFTVSNTGNVTLTNVTVTDPIVTINGGPIPTLAVGAVDNSTFTGVYVLTQADIDNGGVMNVAVTTGEDPNGDPTQDDDDEDIPTPLEPGIEILKNGFFNDENGDGVAQPGETLSYIFSVTNTGNVTLTNVIVTDPLITVAGAAIAVLPVGATDNMTFTGTYILTQQDVDNASVMNTATVAGTDPSGDPVTDDDPEDTPYIQDPEILLMKSGSFSDENGDGIAQVGETISYTFSVTNTGNVTLTDVTVTDPIVTISGGPIPILLVGQTDNTTFTGSFVLTQADINNGNVPNTAVTSGMDPNGDPVTDDDVEDELIPQMPGIDIIKSGTFEDENGDGIAQVGETISYVFVVENIGNVDLTNVTVTDPIVTVIGGPIALLAPGTIDNTTFTGSYILTQADIDIGGVTNVATASGDDPDGNPTTDNDPEETPTPQEPGIEIVKTGVFQDENGDGLPQVGESIAYTFVVTNTGNVTLSNIAVADPLVSVMGGPLATLAVGATDNTTFSGVYVLVQSDINNGEVLNTATVTSEDPNGTPVNDDDMEETPVEGAPGIDIVKTGIFQDENGDGIPQVGESIAYTFVVSNTGNVTLTNILVTDPLVTVAGGPILILEPGESDIATYTGSYILTQIDVNNGEVLNTATVTGQDPDGNTLTDNDDEQTPYDLNPDISLLKSGTLVDDNGDGIIQAGETITYLFTVINTGNVTLTNVTVTDPLVTVSGGPIPVFNPGDIDNTSFTGIYVLTQADIDAGMFENTAITSGEDPNGDPVTDISDDPQNPEDVDPDGDGDPDDPTIVLVPPMPAIEIVKEGILNDQNGDGIPQVGETITYSFVITNTGNVTLTQIVVNDPLVTVSGGPIASLAPGQSDNATFSGTYTLTQADVNNGEVLNTATVTGTDPSGNPTTDDDGEDIPVIAEPGIDIVKTGVFQDENGDGLPQVGESIAYTFVVTNTGNVTLSNIAVADPLVTVMGGPLATLAVGAVDNTTFTGSYILMQSDINNGAVLNTATVSAEDPNGGPVNDDDMEETPVIGEPGISLIKTGVFQDENGDGLPQVGESISYTFAVTNTGNVTLTNVVVTDPIVTVSGGPIAILEPGVTDVTTFSGVYILTLTDINNGEVLNTATVTGEDPNGGTLTDNDDDQTPYDLNPEISLLKSGTLMDSNGDGIIQAGETITYVFTVINTGNVTLTNVTVTDPLVTVSGGPIPVFNPGDVDNTTFTGMYVITQADIDAGMVENTAITSGEDPNGDPVTDISDDPQNPTDVDQDGDGDPDDPTIVLVPPMPAIEIVKEGTLNDENGDGIAQVGESISYSFVITNTGNVTLTQIVVNDPLVTVSGGPITSLAPGQSDNTTFSGSYTLTQADIDNGEVLNTASVTGTDPSGNPTTNTDMDDIPVPTIPCIELIKTSSLDLGANEMADVGDIITYTYTVTNCGNVTLMNVNISEEDIMFTGAGPLPVPSAVVPSTLAPGDTGIATSTYAITQADIDATGINNQALATGTPPSGDDVMDLSDTGNPNDPNETGGDDDPTYTPILLPPGDISGTVFDDIDNNSTGDNPLPDVTITLIDSNGDTLVTVTDENGFYSFTDVVPGPFTIIEEDPEGYFSVTDSDGGDPNVIMGVLDPGEDKTDQDFVDGICDELVCNNDLQISLNVACELVLTPDMLLEAPAPGLYDIMLYDEHGDYIRDDTLTAAEAGMEILYQISCLDNSCWGHIIVETNIIPQLDSPCACTEDGIIPDECKLLCGIVENVPTALITVEEATAAFGECGPDLLGEIKVTETVTGDICDEGGEIVELIYTGKVIRHGTVETVEILCQRYSTIKLEVDNNSFDFPRSVVLDCDYLDHIVVPEGEDPIIYILGEPASILASTGSGSLSYPTFTPNAVDGFDFANYTVPQVVTLFDTTLVEIDQVLRDTMVKEIVGGEEIWVLKTVVDKIYEEQITESLDTIGVMDAVIPIVDRLCNVLSGYSDVEFDACGQGKKILRTWNLIDWCTSDVTITGNQTIEIIDVTPPQIVELIDGEYVEITSLSDLSASIEPWACTGKLRLPDLKILDNCDLEPTVIWDTDEGRVENGYLVDLWLNQSPITVTGSVVDDCNNVSQVSFNVIVVDDVPPVPVCETSLQVSLTGSSDNFGIAKVYAADLDEGSHDSGCGKVTITAVRIEDWREPIRDCQENIVGYAPKTCAPLTADIDLGAPIFKNDCDATGENIGQITVAGDHVKFCCEDLGQIVQVILFVEDEQGNVNQCVVSVEVVDKSAPSLVCSDVTISCADGDYLAPPAMVGASCERETPYSVELLSEDRGNNVCAGGQVVREWYVDLDFSGDFSTGDAYCQQIVVVDADTAFDPYTIKWPKHYDGKQLSGINLELNDEGEIVEIPKTIDMGDTAACTPDDIGEDGSSGGLGLPVWCDTECGLVGYSMDTDTIKASDACLKIIRRWTIVDWCTYDPNGSNIDDENDSATDSFEAIEDWVQFEPDAPSCPTYAANIGDAVYFRYTDVDRDGYYTYDQVIVVNDDTAPEIDAPASYEVNTSGGATSKDDAALCIGEEVITVSANDLCGGEMTGASLLEWQITVSKDGAVVASKTSRGAEASMNSQAGSPGDEHIITWRVKDGCGNATSAQTVVTFGDRQNPTPFCVSGLTTAFMASDGTVAVWGQEFDFGSFDNCTAASDLRFSLVRSGEEPIQPGDVGFSDQSGITFHCQEASDFDELDMWVWDSYGNGDFCTVGILISDNGNACPEDNGGGNGNQGGSSAVIAGQVHTYYDMMIEDAEVTVQTAGLSEYPRQDMTNANGQYTFENNPMAYNYNLQANKEDSYIEGVSTLDVVMMTRHILSLATFENPYQLIASDASGDGDISAQDLTQFRQLILGVTDELSNSLPWIFVDASQVFFDEENPWPFTEEIGIDNLANDMLTEDFIGIKVGDVNQSYQGAESRTTGLLTLQAENASLVPGDITTIEVTAQNFSQIAGYQFTLAHEGLRFVGLESGAIQVTDDNIGILEEMMTMSWNEGELVSVLPEETLFSLRFEAIRDVELSSSLAINSAVTKAEAYVSSDFDLYAIDMTFGEDIDAFALYQNQPNPFTSTTTIGFDLPQADMATITVFDLSGKEIKTIRGQFVKGYNEIRIDAKDLDAGGVLYYQLESGSFTDTRKMILMK